MRPIGGVGYGPKHPLPALPLTSGWRVQEVPIVRVHSPGTVPRTRGRAREPARRATAEVPTQPLLTERAPPTFDERDRLLAIAARVVHLGGWTVDLADGMEHLSAPGARNRLRQAYTFLDKLGRVSEITGKIAGYKLLKADAQRSPQEIGHVLCDEIDQRR